MASKKMAARHVVYFWCMAVSLLVVSGTSSHLPAMRLRGGFSRTLASTFIGKESPRLSQFSSKFSGGDIEGTSEDGGILLKKTEVVENQHAPGDDDIEYEEEDAGMDEPAVLPALSGKGEYDVDLLHRVNPR
jgi:hypothetical protein